MKRARLLLLLLLVCLRPAFSDDSAPGLTALFRGDPAEAVRCFERVLQGRPAAEQRQTARFYLGFSLEKLGRTAEALPHYASLLAEAPQSPYAAEALYRSGRLQEAAGRRGQALVLYQQVVRRAPQGRLALLGRFGVANLKLLQAQDLSGARSCYGATVEACQSRPAAEQPAYRYLSDAARGRIEFIQRYSGEQQALSRYLEALRLVQEGRPDRAAGVLQELLARHPQSKLAAAARHELAACAARQADWDRTVRLCDRFERLYPEYGGLPEVLALRSKATLRRCEKLVDDLTRQGRSRQAVLADQHKLQQELRRVQEQIQRAAARAARR